MTQKNYHVDKILCHNKKKSLKKAFKVALQYPFSVFILFNIIFNLKLNFKLKIDPKLFTFKNLEKKLKKASFSPGYV